MRAYLTVLDDDAALVPYWVRHYLRLGATLFPVTCYGSDIDAVCRQVREAGGEPLPLASFTSDQFSAGRRESFIRQNHPDGQWAFFCDLDEFAALSPRRLARLMGYAPYIRGWWLDRCGRGGQLVTIDPARPLQPQFPWEAKTRQAWGWGSQVYVASPFAPCCHHPDSCRLGKRHLAKAPLATVHHFRWQSNLVARLEKRLARIAAMGKQASPWYERVAATLARIRRNGGVPKQLARRGTRLDY